VIPKRTDQGRDAEAPGVRLVLMLAIPNLAGLVLAFGPALRPDVALRRHVL